MTNSQSIVDFLLANKPFIIEVMEKVHARSNPVHHLFTEEFQEQKLNETKKQLVDQICKSLGCTIEDFHDTIDDKALNTYLNWLDKKDE